MELPKKPRSPVELNHCIEELLRHTLAFAVAGTLDTDIGLSDDFCANLLHDDTSNSTVPLYKRLAASLYQCISSGDILRTDSEVAVMHETCSLKQKEDGCNYKVVREKGSELINVLKTVDFELHVQEPFFSHLRSGEKTIEGRCALGDYNKIEVGASILFNKCLVLQVQDVHRYASFREMLEAEPLSKVLPGIKSTEEGVKVYRNFYSEEKERSNGVLAICVAKPVSQPYLSMASIISERFKLWRSSQSSKLFTELRRHLILSSCLDQCMFSGEKHLNLIVSPVLVLSSSGKTGKVVKDPVILQIKLECLQECILSEKIGQASSYIFDVMTTRLQWGNTNFNCLSVG